MSEVALGPHEALVCDVCGFSTDDVQQQRFLFCAECDHACCGYCVVMELFDGYPADDEVVGDLFARLGL